jgi:hypothetical protein
MRPTSRSPAGGGYLYRAVDQYGQVIDIVLSEQRDTVAARRFFTGALRVRAGAGRGDHGQRCPYLRVLDELVPRHCT